MRAAIHLESPSNYRPAPETVIHSNCGVQLAPAIRQNIDVVRVLGVSDTPLVDTSLARYNLTISQGVTGTALHFGAGSRVLMISDGK